MFNVKLEEGRRSSQLAARSSSLAARRSPPWLLGMWQLFVQDQKGKTSTVVFLGQSLSGAAQMNERSLVFIYVFCAQEHRGIENGPEQSP